MIKKTGSGGISQYTEAGVGPLQTKQTWRFWNQMNLPLLPDTHCSSFEFLRLYRHHVFVKSDIHSGKLNLVNMVLDLLGVAGRFTELQFK